MSDFFRFKDVHSLTPEEVARAYGKYMFNRRDDGTLVVPFRDSHKSRFTIALSVSGSSRAFETLTKRTTLVSDTLLLSHQSGNYHKIEDQRHSSGRAIGAAYSGFDPGPGITYGILCPDIVGLGKWIIAAEPLLKAGLSCYLPSYRVGKNSTYYGALGEQEFVNAADLLIRNGRAVDASGAEPIKSQLVRPVLRAELPFVEGVNLQDFSKITIEEFASYSGFRDFLRHSFLDMDTSLNDVHSDRELVKLGLRINDQIRAVRADMEKAHRKRIMAVTGATIGTVGAILVAVYGPALAAAVATIGASGGLWGIINAAADNNNRSLREDKWYYVWTLAKHSNISII